MITVTTILPLEDREVDVEIACTVIYPNRFSWCSPGEVTLETIREAKPEGFIGPRREWRPEIVLADRLYDSLAEYCYEHAILDN